MEIITREGERIPAVVQNDMGAVACPHRHAGCAEETHEHGVDGELMTHRVAHCRSLDGSKVPAARLGYYVLRAAPGLLPGTSAKWWREEKPGTVRNLGLTGTVGYDGPGLLNVGRVS